MLTSATASPARAATPGRTSPASAAASTRVYLLESLIVPSKVVSDQYLGSVIRTLDGEVVTGRVIEEDDKEIKVRTDPFARELVTIAKTNIEARQQSRVSEMPQGLINTLTKEEILDLIAYMRSAGNAQDKAFAPQANNCPSRDQTWSRGSSTLPLCGRSLNPHRAFMHEVHKRITPAASSRR